MSARDFLEAELAEAYIVLGHRDTALEDAQRDRDTANERVIEIEVALADLARLEGPLFSPTPPTDTHQENR